MNFTFRQLLYAVATARCGSLSMAAEEPHVSQPSLSSAIDQIEAQLGQRVFARRRGSGASLTPFGRTFVGQARRVLEEMRRLEHLSQIDSEVSGELVLGCFDDLAPYCAPALMRRLEERWPRLRLTVQEEGFAALQRRLAAAGVVFEELVESTRFELASHYLKQAHLSLTEIGYLLGYAELSTFSRAFRRWLGCSPQTFRRKGQFGLS